MSTESNNPQPIRVIIADDHVLYRAGVKAALSAKKDIKVIAEADNGMHLLNMIGSIEADVVLLDIQMPIMDGIATLPELKKKAPHLKVIMLTMMDDQSMITTLTSAPRSPQKFAPMDAQLTEKEITILRLMCEEKSTKEIADLVELSPRTVEAIRDKLKVKTGAKSTAGLIMYAVKNNILDEAL